MVVRLSISCKQTTVIACVASSSKLHYGAVQSLLLSWNHLLINSEYFICSDSVLPLECSGLFPKHLIHSLIILLHQNMWMGCYASIEQVLGPPFDKMSHTVTARQVCQIQSPTTEATKRVLTRRSEFELDWQMSRRVTLLPVLTQTHS